MYILFNFISKKYVSAYNSTNFINEPPAFTDWRREAGEPETGKISENEVVLSNVFLFVTPFVP
jgi:hypothetical protein